MVDISTKGFLIIVLSIAGLIYPADWFFGLLTVSLFALVGWTIIGIAGEIEDLHMEIHELKREIRALERRLDGAERG